MKQKKLHPIIYFSLIFIVLVSIQTYFLYNTVLLKKNEIKTQAKELLEKKDDIKWDENLYKYSIKKASEDNFITKMNFVNDSLSPLLQKFVEEQYRKTGLKLAFKKELISVYDLKAKKEVLSKPLIIYQTNPKPVQNHLLNESKWESTYSASETENLQNVINNEGLKQFVSQHTEHSYIIYQATYYDVLNLNQILFKELWGLFLVSVVLMILVLWLYFQSYKKYKEQYLQVLFLHDTIDNISHEFRTPLSTLKVASKQIRIIQNEETLDLIDRQIHRLEHLLKPLDKDDDSTKMVTEQQLIDFLQDYKVLYPNINWKLKIQLTNDIKLNAVEIETILGNLIENSIKYGGETLAVTICQTETLLQILVEDDGMGIAKNEHQKVFGKYYRIATNNVHNVKGLGLGLYLVQKIVQKHNGTILIKSDLGKGCQINIQI